MIAYWPKGITVKKGGYSKQVGHVMDFMNTFIELAGAQYPAHYNGHAIQKSSGVSLVPSFKGKVVSGHEELFNEHFGARYARVGNWKLVSASNDSTWHLFNLAEDKSEVHDLAAQEPVKVKELEGLWREWATTHSVLPKPKKK